MKASQVRCPNCRAILKVPEAAATVTCEYCGSQSRLQAPTTMFRRAAPPLDSAVAALPVAVRGRSLSWLVIGAAFGVASVAGATGYILRARPPAAGVGKASSGSTSARPPLAEAMQWNGGTPIVTDLDGDGVADVIGVVRYVHAGDTLRLAAFSGADGARRWQTPVLGTYLAAYQGRALLVDDRVVFAFPDGRLAAFAAGDGAPAWTLTLPERLSAMCREAGGAIVVQVADERRFTLDASAGALTERDPGEDGAGRRRGRSRAAVAPACLPLPDDTRAKAPGLRVRDGWKQPTVPGMKVQASFERMSDGPAAAGAAAEPIVASILQGYRSPGTAVPMLAGRSASGAVLWKVDVPATDPLGANGGDHVALAADQVCTLYGPGSHPTRMTCFGLSGGERQWDVEIASGMTVIESLVATERRLLLSSWGSLQVFDRKNGALLYVIGDR